MRRKWRSMMMTRMSTTTMFGTTMSTMTLKTPNPKSQNGPLWILQGWFKSKTKFDRPGLSDVVV